MYELLELSDTQILDLITCVRTQKQEIIKKRTNRFGAHKKLPKKELDELVSRFKELAIDISKLESSVGYPQGELMRHILTLATSNDQTV